MTSLAPPPPRIESGKTAAAPEPRRWPRALVVGATAAVTSTAVGALVSSWASSTSAVASVAGVVIDGVPGPVRRWAISTFGTADKLVLGIGIVVVLALVGAVVAASARRHRAVVPVAIVVLAIVGLGAADDLGGAALVEAAASAVAAWASFALLGPFVPRSGPGASDASLPEAQPMVLHRWEAPVDRRDFVARAGSLWAGAAIAGSVASVVSRNDTAAVRSVARTLPRLPAGSPDAAPPVPSGASVGSGATPFITPNADFYRIDTAFIAPRVSVSDWRLDIGGAVDRPLSLTYDELLERHVVERVMTLCCVSNEIGGELVGTASFIGVPLAELLTEAGARPDEGTQLSSVAVDGWACGFPTALALDGRDALVAVGMNGEPLPVEHGFPVRLVVPGLYGYVSATKWLRRIDLVGWDEFDGYWIPRGWAKDGPVKTQSRIDVPRSGDTVTAGPVAIAGVAWAQHRGIDAVEIRIDEGPWVPARLGDAYSDDTWRQWVHEWDATPGRHLVSVRATDGTGEVQTDVVTPVAPNGASGHHQIEVDVA